MKKNYTSGIAFGLLVAAGTLAMTVQSGMAADSKAKQQLMSAIDKCEMMQKTDARETCMDEAWASYKKAHAMEAKTK